MKTNQRINILIGQLEGIKSMITEERDCFDVLVQMKAVKSSYNSLIRNYVEEQFDKKIEDCSEEDRTKASKRFINELANL